MKKLLFFLLLAGSLLAFGQEQKLVTVEARGMGTTPDAATKDALSQAIQQAAGAIVDSQTLMKNDEIMQEKILTASNAIVKKYDVLVPVKKNRNGLYEIRIRAQVEQNLLRQKLVEHKLIKGKVEGAQNIWAEFITQEKNQVDMQAMIENVIAKIDFRKYLQFTIIGANKKMGNEAQLYVKQRPNSRKILVQAGLVCIFDAARFQKECMPHLKKIFDSLPFEQKKEFTHQAEPETKVFSFPAEITRLRLYNPRRQLQELATKGHSVITSYRDTPCVGSQGVNVAGYDRVGICLNVSPKYRPGSQRYVCYGSSKINLAGVTQKKRAELEKLSVSLCLLDGDGQEVRRITCHLRDSISYVVLIRHNRNFIISPEFEGRYGINLSPVVILPLSTEIDVDDFKDIKSFKLEVDMGK